jgi:hypothetical protein
MTHADRSRALFSRGALVAVLAAACGEASAPPLEWVTPAEDGPVPVGEVVELGVTTPDPDAVAIEFLVDGERVAACDPSAAEEDCKLGDVWRWSVVFQTPGAHTIGASYEGASGTVSISRELEVVVPPPESELLAAEEQQVEPDDGTAVPDEEPALATLATRGLLDPDRGYHRIFGGIEWAVKSQRVVLRTGTPRSSVSAVQSCMNRYGASIRKWAEQYKLSRASVVATAITESNCTNPRGSSDGLSSGPMQVTASTCAALTGLSRTTCRSRMHTSPDFSFQVGAKYMGSSFQRNQHHRDPPKIAAAYSAGSLRSTTANRWHMVSTGNHIDRWVRAYNAYRRWEAQVAALILDDGSLRWDGEHAATTADLPADAVEGQVVFVGDFTSRDGAFWQLAGGTWRSTDEED